MSRPFWWFQGETVQKLTDQLIDAGPDAVLEVHIHGDDMRLYVRSDADKTLAAEDGGLNESHMCPPVCRE